MSFARKMKLTNGLTVIYEKNSAADVVSLNIGVKVGSVDEQDDESGICHLIEHMVFKGTKTYKAGEIATIVEASGGELNAYTSLDQTVYYINLPSRHFELGINILKEMVFDAAFDADELEREKEVVVEEIRRGNDNPQRVLSEILFKTHYNAHPYRRPVIGTEAHVRGFSAGKIRSFYQHWYQPKNMILGICGNIEESRLSAVLESLFRFEVSGPEVNHEIANDIPAERPRIVMKALDIQSTFFDVAFTAPNVHHEDVPALDVLSHLLGEGPTSLLEQITKEKNQLMHAVYSSCYTPKHPGLFVVGGMVDHRKINDALASVREQIETAQRDLFSADKIERIKVMLRAQTVFDKETCEGTARKWISFETVIGDYKYDEKYLEMVAHLTPEDIRCVAQKYLQIKNSILVVIHPKNVSLKIDRSFFKEKLPKKLKRTAFKPVEKHEGAEVYVLKNGVRVVLRSNRRLPITAIKMTSLGGLRFESPQNNGISNLMASLLSKGAAGQSQLQIAEKVEALAAHLSGYAGRNSWGVSFSLLSEKLKEGLPLYRDVILFPDFTDDEVDKERRLQLEGIRNREDNPSQMAFRLALQDLFAGHPYAYHMLGEAAVVKKFTANKIRDFHRRLTVPANLVFSVSGDFVTDEILGFFTDNFGSLTKKSFQEPKIKKVKPIVSPKKQFSFKQKEQAHVVYGFQTTSLYDKDHYVLDVINAILSGQGGRLFLDLRDQQSLAYTVTSTQIEGLDIGFFGGYIGTEPSKVGQALEGLNRHFAKLCAEPVPTEELERAKNYIIGNHAIDAQRNGGIAMQLALNTLYGVGIKEYFQFEKKILAVTAKDIQRVARRYFNPKASVLAIVGPKMAKVW